MAGLPYHIVQRGNNREACFFAEADYLFYLQCLRDACVKYGVSCHAYVLMTNHTHLLLTPSCDIGISRVMQSLGRRYVQYVNARYRRWGTLWEGRHKSSVVDAENYLFVCYRYIEMNPVRAGMVVHPGDYRWSSFHFNAFGIQDDAVTSHPLVLALGQSTDSRLASYRELFADDLPIEMLHQVRNAANFSKPLGNAHFRRQINRALFFECTAGKNTRS